VAAVFAGLRLTSLAENPVDKDPMVDKRSNGIILVDKDPMVDKGSNGINTNNVRVLGSNAGKHDKCFRTAS
jgi:hypothetical protein